MVSVIIPAYKVEEYLRQCVDSVINQTYKRLEIILVDDGSPDNCGTICDEYAAMDDRVRVIHKENGGLSDARNAGLNVATGEYILFVDGDDYIDPSLVETVVTVMDQGNDLVAFRFWRVCLDGSKIAPKPFAAGSWNLETSNDKAQFYTKTLLQYRIGWEAWNRMYRRELIERLYLRFEDNQRIFAEDLYFSICYCLQAKKIVCLEDKLYFYRWRDDSIMGRESIRLNVGRMNELSKCVSAFLRQNKAPEEVLSMFPIMHYFIIHNVANNYKRKKKTSPIRLRKLMLKDVEDKEYFFAMLKQIRECQSQLEEWLGKREALHVLKVADYWCTGKLMNFLVRSVAEKRFKRTII